MSSVRQFIEPLELRRLLAITFTGGLIDRITPAGVITKFIVPGGSRHNAFHITTGPDGNVWFTEIGVSYVGRVTLSTGAVQEFPVAADQPPYNSLYDIATG